VRRLIINADDFGLTPGINRGILRAHQHGVVTSTTMMAAAPATVDAADLVAFAGKLSVGCHIVLIDGHPISPASQVPSLVAKSANGARFYDAWLKFARASMRGKLSQEEIATEVRAQIATLGALGVYVSHVDTHKHTHALPWVLKPLLRAARDCGVTAIRNPIAPLHTLAFTHLLRRPKLWKRYGQVHLLQRVARDFQRAVADAGMRTPDGTLGILVTGAFDERLFEAIAGSIPDGTWEFVCHPGYCDDDLRGVKTRLRESRANELEVLTSDAAQQALDRHGVELISYWEL
jgi:predicted glycoside hydrolase/deacetylase ChbG (UPF0249 family)